jgi:hypothetical protein
MSSMAIERHYRSLLALSLSTKLIHRLTQPCTYMRRSRGTANNVIIQMKKSTHLYLQLTLTAQQHFRQGLQTFAIRKHGFGLWIFTRRFETRPPFRVTTTLEKHRRNGLCCCESR